MRLCDMPVRILIVDDSPTIRRSLSMLVAQESDWEICGEAENGKLAVEMAQRVLPDVVVLDLSMPVMNGLEAARQIRETAPDTYVFLFTLHASPQLLEAASKAGINEVMSKSSDISRLLGAVRSLRAA